MALALVPVSVSCDYLDKAPDSGLSEEEVFSKYANFKSFLYTVYDGANTKIRAYHPLTFAFNNKKFTMESITDMYDMARLTDSQTIRLGNGSGAVWIIGYNTADSNNKNKEAAKVKYAWPSIRICNMAIQKIDMLQDATEQQKLDLLAQAYFIRAYINFEIFRLYGAVPYVDKVLGPDDEWDLPAETEYDFCIKCANDFQTAADLFAKAGLMRRDEALGYNLNAPDQDKPNGTAALAMKARALLYAASPLNTPPDAKAAWDAAAQANWKAIEEALKHNFKMFPKDEWTRNFYGSSYTHEQLWGFPAFTNTQYKNSLLQGFVAYCFSKDKYSSAQCPTQNFVDKFETMDGYALNTPENRQAATAAGSYNEQNPYVNRDPRFGMTIIYNQKDLSKGGFTGDAAKASLYILENGKMPDNSLLKGPEGAKDGATVTYYYENKRTGGPYNPNTQNITLTDPIIRLAELYLNYAEAAFEAYGMNGSAPGASMTSLDALNHVRARVGMPEVREEYLDDGELYKSRIKNERAVELASEGYHYYCDIRRWKDAPEIYRRKLYGMRATKLNDGYDPDVYPTGFRYERVELPAERQITWKNDGQYYIQFDKADLKKMKNYTPKMEW